MLKQRLDDLLLDLGIYQQVRAISKDIMMLSKEAMRTQSYDIDIEPEDIEKTDNVKLTFKIKEK